MKAAVFDNETTGLTTHPDSPLANQPHVIEFGAIIIDENYEIIDRCEKLIHPGFDIPEVITGITGISAEDVVHEGNFAERFKKINKFIEQADVAFAHNFSFDKNVLDYECQRIGKEINWPAFQVCTVQMNVPVYGYRVKLQDLYTDITGKKWKQEHRAMADVMALYEIIKQGNYLEAIAAAVES